MTSSPLQLLHRGKQLAANAIASSDEKLAFVGVYPLDLNRTEARQMLRRLGIIAPAEGQLYRLRLFEIERTLVEQDVSIAEEHLSNVHDVFAHGDEDLVIKLEELGLTLNDLAQPYETLYPI